jgi:hypothetical protein
MRAVAAIIFRGFSFKYSLLKQGQTILLLHQQHIRYPKKRKAKK